MGRFDEMRASSRFNSRPFGMPEMDSMSLKDIMNDISPLVYSMKNDDAFRQKQMMEFENSLRQSNRPPVLAPPPPKKNFVVNYGQAAKLAPSPVEANNAARDAKVAQLNKEFAAINEQRGERQATRDSAEKIAGQKLAAETLENTTQREFTAGENKKNRDQKGQPYMMPDPNDPSKQIAVRWNPATETVEPIKYNDQTIGNLTKPGTPSKTGQFVQPKNIDVIRGQAQSVLDEIKTIVDDQGELTPEGARAVGKSSIANWIPTTKGFAGAKSINRVKAHQILNLIGELKAQSKTGATGFGNMSNKDLSVLEDAASKLDTGLDEATFKKEIIRIRGMIQKIMEEDGATQPEQDRVGTTSTGKRPRLDPDELLRKYGG